MVPANVAAITDPVERTRAYMDAIAVRWQVLRNLQPPATESQFWLDTAAWEAYYQLRRGGAFGITSADWQGAWSDSEQWDQKLTAYEGKFLAEVPPGPLPPKPGLPEPTSSSSSSSKPFPWELAVGLGLVVLVGGLIYWEI